MSKEKKKIIRRIVLAAIVIFVVVYWLFPFAMSVKRRIVIKLELEKVYTGTTVKNVKCVPMDKESFEHEFIWRGAEFEDEVYYYFTMCDSNDNVGNGFATKDGTVLYDDYANDYYEEEIKKSFQEAVDFEKNFPELDYFISGENYINTMSTYRFVPTHECTTFEGYKHPESFGYHDIRTRGYAGLIVGFKEDTSDETIESIKALLEESDFDIFIEFRTATGDWSDHDSLYIHERLGVYFPFEPDELEKILSHEFDGEGE